MLVKKSVQTVALNERRSHEQRIKNNWTVSNLELKGSMEGRKRKTFIKLWNTKRNTSQSTNVLSLSRFILHSHVSLERERERLLCEVEAKL